MLNKSNIKYIEVFKKKYFILVALKILQQILTINMNNYIKNYIVPQFKDVKIFKITFLDSFSNV